MCELSNRCAHATVRAKKIPNSSGGSGLSRQLRKSPLRDGGPQGSTHHLALDRRGWDERLQPPSTVARVYSVIAQ